MPNIYQDKDRPYGLEHVTVHYDGIAYRLMRASVDAEGRLAELRCEGGDEWCGRWLEVDRTRAGALVATRSRGRHVEGLRVASEPVDAVLLAALTGARVALENAIYRLTLEDSLTQLRQLVSTLEAACSPRPHLDAVPSI